MQCMKACSIYIQSWSPLYTWAARLCRWELVRSSYLLSGSCMGDLWSMSCAKSLFCLGQEVRSKIVIFPWANWYHCRYAVLPALSLDGILHLSIVQGSFNYESFAKFIEGLLMQMNLFPGPNSVIVMDNCRIHKSPLVLDMICKAYVYCYYFIIILISKQMVMLQWMALRIPPAIFSWFQPHWARFFGYQSQKKAK